MQGLTRFLGQGWQQQPVETLRTVANGVWCWSWASACLGVGWPTAQGLLHPREMRTQAHLPHLKCEGEAAVLIPISRGSSSLGGNSCLLNHPGGLALALLGLMLLLAILTLSTHFSPEGVRGPNWGRMWSSFEEKFSLCFRGVRAYFQGVIIQEERLESKKWFLLPLIPQQTLSKGKSSLSKGLLVLSQETFPPFYFLLWTIWIRRRKKISKDKRNSKFYER